MQQCFVQGLEHQRALDCAGVPRVLAIYDPPHGAPAALIQRVPGVTLEKACDLPLVEFDHRARVSVVAAVVDTIAELHTKRDHNYTVHRDVSPSNIIVDLETKTVALIDFDLSWNGREETLGKEHVQGIEINSQYQAPNFRAACWQDKPIPIWKQVDLDCFSLSGVLLFVLTGLPPEERHTDIVHAVKGRSHRELMRDFGATRANHLLVAALGGLACLRLDVERTRYRVSVTGLAKLLRSSLQSTGLSAWPGRVAGWVIGERLVTRLDFEEHYSQRLLATLRFRAYVKILTLLGFVAVPSVSFALGFAQHIYLELTASVVLAGVFLLTLWSLRSARQGDRVSVSLPTLVQHHLNKVSYAVALAILVVAILPELRFTREAVFAEPRTPPISKPEKASLCEQVRTAYASILSRLKGDQLRITAACARLRAHRVRDIKRPPCALNQTCVVSQRVGNNDSDRRALGPLKSELFRTLFPRANPAISEAAADSLTAVRAGTGGNRLLMMTAPAGSGKSFLFSGKYSKQRKYRVRSRLTASTKEATTIYRDDETGVILRQEDLPKWFGETDETEDLKLDGKSVNHLKGSADKNTRLLLRELLRGSRHVSEANQKHILVIDSLDEIAPVARAILLDELKTYLREPNVTRHVWVLGRPEAFVRWSFHQGEVFAHQAPLRLNAPAYDTLKAVAVRWNNWVMYQWTRGTLHPKDQTSFAGTVALMQQSPTICSTFSHLHSSGKIISRGKRWMKRLELGRSERQIQEDLLAVLLERNQHTHKRPTASKSRAYIRHLALFVLTKLEYDVTGSSFNVKSDAIVNGVEARALLNHSGLIDMDPVGTTSYRFHPSWIPLALLARYVDNQGLTDCSLPAIPQAAPSRWTWIETRHGTVRKLGLEVEVRGTADGKPVFAYTAKSPVEVSWRPGLMLHAKVTDPRWMGERNWAAISRGAHVVNVRPRHGPLPRNLPCKSSRQRYLISPSSGDQQVTVVTCNKLIQNRKYRLTVTANVQPAWNGTTNSARSTASLWFDAHRKQTWKQERSRDVTTTFCARLGTHSTTINGSCTKNVPNEACNVKTITAYVTPLNGACR